MVEQTPTHRNGSLTARKVSIRTPLVDVETFEKETATFHLELSHPGVSGVWTRDGIRVKPSSTCRISATGCGHSLTLERLALEDSGTVTFTADTLRCSAHLHVRGMVPKAGRGGVWHCHCLTCSCSVPGDTKAELGHPGHVCPSVLDRGDSVLASVALSSGRRCELSSGDTHSGSGPEPAGTPLMSACPWVVPLSPHAEMPQP